MGITDLINILNKRYLFFFDKIYYKSLRKFNLKQFYLSDVEIELPDSVKLYKDVLKKNRYNYDPFDFTAFTVIGLEDENNIVQFGQYSEDILDYNHWVYGL